MEWRECAPETLATERHRREAAGAVAARAAPEMELEVRIEIAGVPALKCVPKVCRSSVPHVFVHGGGWVFGSSIQSLGLIRRIAWQTARPVISLDYALAPENPYPRAIEEVSAAMTALVESDGVAGIIGGSAGAQIALHAVSRTIGSGLYGAVLFCGAFGHTTQTWSHRVFGQGPKQGHRKGQGPGQGQLSTHDMQHFLNAYAMPVGPPFPDPSNLPPLFLSVGDLDPLLEDTLQLHAAVQQGNGSNLEIVPNAGHGFMNNWHIIPRIDNAVTDALDWLERRCAASI
ncbi:MAG: alpha/beta hydrolase [Alphaproteobacteria bacterium]|nr:alpha/beta hydrolase [Alphaproteobacteria bacterium]